jgi:hypothetical protein
MALDPRNVLQMGAVKWPPGDGMGFAMVKCSSSGKVDEKPSDGKSDSTITWKGRENRKLDIEMTWPDDSDDPDGLGADEAALKFIADIDPSGANGGKPREWAHPITKPMNVKSIMVKKIDLEYKAGEGIGTAKIEAASWTKPPTSGKGDGGKASTPDEADKWYMGKTPPGTKAGGVEVGGAGQGTTGPTKSIGSNNNSVGGFENPATAPKVKP